MVIPEFIITCWVLVPLGNFLRHFSGRSVLYSVYSVSNCVFWGNPKHPILLHEDRKARREIPEQRRAFVILVALG